MAQFATEFLVTVKVAGSEQLSGMSQQLKDISGTMNSVSQSNASIASSASGLYNLASGLAAIGAALGIVQQFRDLISVGVEFNTIMETSRIGMAAMFSTLRVYTDELGNTLSAENTFNAAMHDSYRVQDLMQSAVFKTNVTLQDLQKTFERVQMGASTQKGTTEDMVRLTVAITNMATATGNSAESLAHQLSLMMNGVVRSQGAMGGFVRSLGLTTAEIKELAKSGDLLQMMLQHMDYFERAGNLIQQSFQGVMSNVRDVKQQLAGAFATPLMELAKELGTKFIGAFTDTWTDAQGNVQTRVSAAGKTMAENFGSGFSDGLRAFATILETVLPKFNSMVVAASNFAINMRMGSEAVMSITGTDKSGGNAAKDAVSQLNALHGWGQSASDMSGLQRFMQLQGGSDPAQGERAIMNQYLAATTKATTDRQTDFKNFMDRQMLIQGHNGQSPQQLIAGGMGNGTDSLSHPQPPKTPDNSKAIAAQNTYQEFLQGFMAKIDTAGLDGLDLALARDEKQWTANDIAIQRATDAAKKLYPEALAFLPVLQAWNDQQRALSDSKAIEEYAAKFQKAISDMDSIAMNDTALDKVDRAFTQNAQKIEDISRKAIQDLGAMPMADALDPQSLIDYAAYLGKLGLLEQSAADATKRNKDKQRLDSDLILSEQLGDYQLYYDTIVKLDTQNKMTLFQAQQDAARKGATMLMAQADTVAKGVTAGFAVIAASAQSSGQAIANTMIAVWGHIGDAFENGLVGSITNGFTGIKDASKSLVTSLVGDWAKMLREMVMGKSALNQSGWAGTAGSFFRGVAGEAPPGADFVGPQPQGYNATAQSAGYVAGQGLQGYAAGSAVGGASGAPGWNSGATIGGTVAAVGVGAGIAAGLFTGAQLGVWGGPLGIAIGAVIGGIIGVLTAPNTEQHAYVAGSSAFQSINGTPQGAYGTSMTNTAGKVTGGLLDLYSASGLGGRTAFADGMRTAITAYLTGLKFDIHAGSTADMQADLDKLLTGIVPAEMMHKLFGQTSTLGGQNYAGISGGLSFANSPVGENGPLTKFMEDLGFTVQKVQWVAGQVDARSTADFNTFLTALISTVIAFKDNIKNLSKTSTELFADAAKSSDQTAIESFHASAVALTQQAKELSQYSGDDQLARAKTLNDAVAARYTQELALIQQIIAAIASEHAAFQTMQMSYTDTVNRATMTPAAYADSRTTDWNTRIYGDKTPGPGTAFGTSGYREQIMGESDPSKVLDLAARARQAIGEFFDYLNSLLTQNLELLGQFNDLKANFGAGENGIMAAANPDKSLGGFLGGVSTLSNQIIAASKLSGQAQIDALKKVQVAAADRYAEELQFIRDIQASLAAFLDQSKSLKETIKMDGMSDPEKATYLAGKLRQDSTDLQNATDPAEVTRLQNEIITLGGQYYALFKDGDPAKAAAGAWLTDVLNRAEVIAKGKATEITNIILTASQAYATAMGDAATLTTTTIGTITETIDGLNTELGLLDAAVKTQLTSTVDALVLDNQALALALAADEVLFTNLNGALDGLASPGGAVDRTISAFDRLAAKFDGFDPTSSGGKAPAENPLRAGIAAAVYVSRNMPYALNPQTGV